MSRTLDNAIRNATLLTKVRNINDQLNRINIMRNNHQLSLLILDQSNAMIQSLLDKVRFFPDLAILLSILGDGLGLLDKSSLLLLQSLGTVFIQEFEELHGIVLVERVGKLGEGRRDLEAFFEDFLLSLQTDVLGPFDVAGHILVWLYIAACFTPTALAFSSTWAWEWESTDPKVFRTLLDERILGLFGALVSRGERGGCDLLLRCL